MDCFRVAGSDSLHTAVYTVHTLAPNRPLLNDKSLRLLPKRTVLSPCAVELRGRHTSMRRSYVCVLITSMSDSKSRLRKQQRHSIRPARKRPACAVGTEKKGVQTVAAKQTTAKQPNILIIWGDDIGWFNVSAYNLGIMGYRTPNIDRVAQGRRDVHRLVRTAELHRRPRRVHHRPVAHPHRPHQGRACPAPTSACGPKTRRSPSCSSRWVTSPASSARTTWATATSSCPPPTASTSSSATSTT